MKIKVLTYVTFYGLLAGLVFLFHFSSYRNGLLSVSDIRVEFEEGSNELLGQETVNKLLIQSFKDPEKVTKSVIDLHGIENNIHKHPYIEKASVFLTIDGQLKTTVKQRTPIARIYAEDTSYYIDNFGVKMPLSDHYSARVMLVSGLFSDQELVKISRLIRQINADDFLHKELIGLVKRAPNEYVFDIRSGRQKIIFGSLDESLQKFKKLKAFYSNTFENNNIDQYRFINLKYHNQVVCTK